MKQHITRAVAATLICAAYSLYFIYLVKSADLKYLIYIDFLIMLCVAADLAYHALKYLKRKSEIKSLLQTDDIIFTELGEFENGDITEHDVFVLQRRLQCQYDDSLELQDYVAKWCHELKLPLSASLIMNEKQKDTQLRASMREQLERMKRQTDMLLQGCRLQSPILDLDIKVTRLSECIKTSIKNNQFFLIQKNFTIDVGAGVKSDDDTLVYTDAGWLVYILDQFISNAVKYSDKPEPYIKIWTENADKNSSGETNSNGVMSSNDVTSSNGMTRNNSVINSDGETGSNGVTGSKRGKININSREITLYIEDNGEGISDSDMRHIFEKGYTGANRRNAKYKSTGMGLYMAAKTANALDSEIGVESVKGEYARFSVKLEKCSADVIH